MTKTALGKGFEGLIPIGFDVSEVATPAETIKDVDINLVVANPDQPRRVFDETALSELAASLKEHGLIQPIILTPYKEKYRIVAGERRYRAAKIAGFKKISAIIRNHKELEEIEVALVENVQRVDLSPLEQAVSIIRLRDQFSLTPKQIAKKLGKAETTVSNIIRLLQLPKEAIDALRKGTISEGHARAILSLKFSIKLQKELLHNIVAEGLSVRDAEEYVKQQKVINEQKSSTISKDKLNRLETLKNRGVSVKIQEKKRGGTIILSFKNDEELDTILDTLSI